MSIPSVSNLSSQAALASTSRASLDSSSAASSAARTPGANAASTTTPDVGKAPTPPRFPWLSRLSAQLQSVAKQKPAFEPAPILGDNIDQSA